MERPSQFVDSDDSYRANDHFVDILVQETML